MRHVELEQVEAGLVGHARGAHVVGAHRVHVGRASIARGTWSPARKGDRRRRESGQLPSAAAARRPPTAVRGALAAGVAELDADLRREAVHELDDPPPRRHVLGLVEPGAAGRDAPLGARRRSSRRSRGRRRRRARLPRCTRCQSSAAVVGRVLAHGRDDDAVLQHQLAQPERREHRRRRAAARCGGRRPALAPRRRTSRRRARRTPGSRSFRFSCVMRRLRVSRLNGELQRCERAEVALGVLEPLEARLRGALRALDRGTARRLVGRERRAGSSAARSSASRERDGVLHRQLGARADREVRGVRGVADEHDVAVVPALVAHRREAAPERAVVEQPVAGELVGEELLADRRRSRPRRLGPSPARATSPRCTRR